MEMIQFTILCGSFSPPLELRLTVLNNRLAFQMNALNHFRKPVFLLGLQLRGGSIAQGECSGTQLQYSCLANPMDGGAWWAAVHGVTKSRTRLSHFTFTFPFHAWRRKWQPTPVFLPGESQGQGSLVGCRLWDRTESDTTEATQQQQHSTWEREPEVPTGENLNPGSTDSIALQSWLVSSPEPWFPLCVWCLIHKK